MKKFASEQHAVETYVRHLNKKRSELASKIEAVRFPPLARQARIQGDVRLHSGPEGIMPVNGHPLLAPFALDNLKELGKLSDAEIEAVYHFVLVNEMARSTTRNVTGSVADLPKRNRPRARVRARFV
jgi:hypothetical protein